MRNGCAVCGDYVHTTRDFWERARESLVLKMTWNNVKNFFANFPATAMRAGAAKCPGREKAARTAHLLNGLAAYRRDAQWKIEVSRDAGTYFHSWRVRERCRWLRKVNPPGAARGEGNLGGKFCVAKDATVTHFHDRDE